MESNTSIHVLLLHLEAQLRDYMMDHLSDADLAFHVPGNPPLGELCREMGNVERAYMESFKTLVMTFDVQRDDSPETAASVDKLKAWYKALDTEFEALLTAVPTEEFDAKIIERSDHKIPAGAHFHGYHEAVLIFCARCSVYLRMMDKPLNDMWLDWIG